MGLSQNSPIRNCTHYNMTCLYMHGVWNLHGKTYFIACRGTPFLYTSSFAKLQAAVITTLWAACKIVTSVCMVQGSPFFLHVCEVWNLHASAFGAFIVLCIFAIAIVQHIIHNKNFITLNVWHLGIFFLMFR